MNKEKFEAQGVQAPVSALERIQIICQGAEFDCQEAEIRTRQGNPQLAAFYRGRASAFNSILSFIREWER